MRFYGKNHLISSSGDGLIKVRCIYSLSGFHPPGLDQEAGGCSLLLGLSDPSTHKFAAMFDLSQLMIMILVPRPSSPCTAGELVWTQLSH
jgi:hypothetical protein